MDSDAIKIQENNIRKYAFIQRKIQCILDSTPI